MTNTATKKVFNLIILDESGSMQSIKTPIINGFNEIIQTIRNAARKEPSLKQWISFWSFNGSGMKEQIPLSEVDQLTELTDETYLPDSNTPLYDAIGQACNTLRKSWEGEKDTTVLVTILTDGEENASQEYSFEAIRDLIKELRDKGWVITYIGANQDVEKVAVSINISHFHQLNASIEGVGDYMAREKTSRMMFYDRLVDLKPGEAEVPYFIPDDEEEKKS